MSMPLDLSLFRQLTDALPFGVYVVGMNRHIEYWNHAAELITGHLSQETLARPCGNGLLMHCDSSGTTACNTPHCPVTYAMHNGLSVETRLFARHKEGHRIPVVVRVIPLRDEQGTVVAAAELFQQEDRSPEDLSWIDDADARIDPVLGVYSAATTERQLRSALARPGYRVAAFLIEIDHLQDLGRKHGTEMTRCALRNVIHTVTRLLNVPHYVGRWEDNTLLVLVPECGHAAFPELHASIGNIGSSCAITWWGDRINLRVLVGGALSEPGNSLEDFMQKLRAGSSRTDQVSGEL